MVAERRKPRKGALRSAVPTSVRDVPASRGMLAGVRDELIERIAAAEKRFEARFNGLEARINGLEAQIHELRADVARVGVLVEEQNTRNAIVLEAIRAMIDRQDHR